MATTHDLAHDLQKLAEHLLAQSATDIPSSTALQMILSNKEEFVAMARALPKPLNKDAHEDSYFFKLLGAVGCLGIELFISRSQVCTLVTPAQPAVYECEPLFGTEEEKQFA